VKILPWRPLKRQPNLPRPSGDADIRRTCTKALIVRKIAGGAAGIACLLATFPVMSNDVSTSEFLMHCDAAPEPCKKTILAYVEFLAEGDLVDRCIMKLPASAVATKLIEWMRDHPEYAGKDWIDCLDDAIATLKLCKS
jgi:hypothetical protein